MERLLHQLAPVLGVAVFLFAWTLGAAALGDLRRFFPWPWQIGEHLAWMLTTQECWTDIAFTVSRTIVAFVAGIILGTPTGVLLGLNPRYYNASRFSIDFIRSIPVTALFPVAMLFFGVGDAAKLACVALGCTLIILVHSAGAVRNLPFIYGVVGRSLHLTKVQAFWKVTLPAALPEIANGMRVASSIALILVIVLEMFLGSSGGLGLRLYNDQQLFRVADMYGTLILIGAIGYLANVVLAFAQEKLLHWGGK